jgi:hypothetical protein
MPSGRTVSERGRESRSPTMTGDAIHHWRLRGSVLRQKRLSVRRAPGPVKNLSSVEVDDRDPAGERFFLRQGYAAGAGRRLQVEEPRPRLVYQPDVYKAAGKVADLLGSRTIIDVGCAWGEKLVPLSARYDIVGLDLGENLEYCRTNYAFGEWLEHDLEVPEPLPLSDAHLAKAVLVCADVIEHLVHPDRLLDKLRSIVDRVDAMLLSTPDREREWGARHNGPPPNPHHVREWSQDELAMFLKARGFDHGFLTHTRSHSRSRTKRTVLAVLVPARNANPLPVIARARP